MKTSQISVTYEDHMGSDLSILNAARQSFSKRINKLNSDGTPYVLNKKDIGLMHFLADGLRSEEWKELFFSFYDFFSEYENLMAVTMDEEAQKEVQNNSEQKFKERMRKFKRLPQHWAPFAHPQVSLRIEVPVFVARQLQKSTVGAVWSEESRRYVCNEPDVWFTQEWHNRPDDVKQGSGGLIENQESIRRCAEYATQTSIDIYNGMLNSEVAPEEARMILTQNMMISATWTGSLAFFARVYNQRSEEHAQKSGTQEFAQKLNDVIEPLFPYAWSALTK